MFCYDKFTASGVKPNGPYLQDHSYITCITNSGLILMSASSDLVNSLPLVSIRECLGKIRIRSTKFFLAPEPAMRAVLGKVYQMPARPSV